MEPDLDALAARARAARLEGERLDDLAREITSQAEATCARHQMLRLSPAVEARLHVDRADAQRSPLTTTREIEPGTRELYDELTDWHPARP